MDESSLRPSSPTKGGTVSCCSNYEHNLSGRRTPSPQAISTLSALAEAPKQHTDGQSLPPIPPLPPAAPQRAPKGLCLPSSPLTRRKPLTQPPHLQTKSKKMLTVYSLPTRLDQWSVYHLRHHPGNKHSPDEYQRRIYLLQMRPKGRKAGREVHLEAPDSKIYADSLGEAGRGERKDRKKRWNKNKAWIPKVRFFFLVLDFVFCDLI